MDLRKTGCHVNWTETSWDRVQWQASECQLNRNDLGGGGEREGERERDIRYRFFNNYGGSEMLTANSKGKTTAEGSDTHWSVKLVFLSTRLTNACYNMGMNDSSFEFPNFKNETMRP
jgi:hypothetical protein